MKLVRYGAFGSEKPGLIDKDGKLRDLSGQVKDLADDAFAPASLAKLAALDPASLPAVSGSPRIRFARRRQAEIHRHRPELCGPCGGIRHADPVRADCLHEGAQQPVRPE
jgi:hypothetical protein